MNLKELLDNKTIAAIDTIDKNTAKKYASWLKYERQVGAIKIGLPLVLSNNLNIIRTLKRKSRKPVILDLKISDIPDISFSIAEQAIKLGCDAVTIQGFVGKEVLKRFGELCNKYPDFYFIVVTGMTHEEDKDNENNLTNLHARQIANWALEVGAHGIIVPGNKENQIKILKEIVDDKLLIIAAGIGEHQGGDPDRARKCGANTLIEGRGLEFIDDSRDRKLYDEIKYYSMFGFSVIFVGTIVFYKIFPNYWTDFVITGSITLIFTLIWRIIEYINDKKEGF